MAADLNELRRIYDASTHISFPDDLRTIIGALKRGDEHNRRVASKLEAFDATEAGRDQARWELNLMFRPRVQRTLWDDVENGGRRRRKTRKSRRKARKTRKSRR
jgi:hypothetical protein